MSDVARCVLITLVLSVAIAWATPVHAHIDMVGSLRSRGGDQKMSPCDGAKGDGPTYTFQPGSTITLALDEYVPHPSYFRIAFDDDGEDFVEPASIEPIDPLRRCPFNADDQCGESDFCTVASMAGGATVLWDNLNPHLRQDAASMKWNVKLPDVECERCTIQVLQVMQDTIHGAYCPQGSCANASASLEDIYHRCIDITLKRGATNSPGATTEPVNNTGMECKPSVPGTMGAAGDAGGSGASGMGGTAGAAGAAGATAGAPAGAAGAAPSGTAGTAEGAGGSGNPGSAGSSANGAGSVASVTAGTQGVTTNPSTAAGTTGLGAVPMSPSAATESDSSCSVRHVGHHSSSSPALASIALGGVLIAVRRRRRRR